ncbi:hypothetical protein [Bacillus cereus]|uniref:hypothetical protein n=1 Tax=Bacillus cereus TaxID=1396 RepID=UPI0022212F66|nr:hypothetical protein [Bacillus cereus]
MKKYFVVGVLMLSLLVGCAQDNTSMGKETPKKSEQVEKKGKSTDKKVDEAKNVKNSEESVKPRPELQTFNTCDSNGKYCDRGMLNVGSFNALSVGMTAEEVTGKLQKNAESSSWATVDGKEAVRYEYSASITSVTVNYIDGETVLCDSFYI